MTQGELNSALNAVEPREDCERIANVVASRLGLFLDLRGAFEIWSWHSDGYAASWMGIRDDEEIVEAVERYVKSRATPGAA